MQPSKRSHLHSRCSKAEKAEYVHARSKASGTEHIDGNRMR